MTRKDMIIDQLRSDVSGVSGFDVRSVDFHTLNSAQVERLVHWAKDYGYRKPKNANGSTARYFHQMLARHANRKAG